MTEFDKTKIVAHIDDDEPQSAHQSRPKRARRKLGRARTNYLPPACHNPLRRLLLEPIVVMIDGKEMSMPVYEAWIRRLYQDSLRGCRKSRKVLRKACGGFKVLHEEQMRRHKVEQDKHIEAVLEAAEKWTV